MSWLTRLIERQIAKARAKGELEGLEGEGRPLPERPGDTFVSAGDVLATFVPDNVLPEEITLRKQVEAQREKLAGLTDPAERKAAMAELARLEMRRSIAEEARKRFMKE